MSNFLWRLIPLIPENKNKKHSCKHNLTYKWNVQE